MTLTVVSVAYPFAPVTVDPAGGAEQVLAQLDRALVAAGHRSIVVATEGSVTADELVTIPASAGEIDNTQRAAAHAQLAARLGNVLHNNDVDLVHLHGIDFAAYLPLPGVPVLVTLHLPLDWYPAGALTPHREGVWFNPVSAEQATGINFVQAKWSPPRRRGSIKVDELTPMDARRRGDDAFDECKTQLLPPIPNGVDTDLYTPSSAKQDYALILGRVAPEKGFHDALHAAKLAGVPLLAAGAVFPYAAHQRYFNEELAPRFDSARRWLGPVHGAAKRRLLAEARCMLIPSTARETSSLVAMEALASGTPVIAYRNGALPGIIDDGVTGYLVDDVASMAAAIERIGAIDPAVCRAAACERFPLQRTTDGYLDLYHRLAA